jgi:hypothetical protein
LAGIFFLFFLQHKRWTTFSPLLSKREETASAKTKVGHWQMTFFLFFLTHLFFGEKKYYIYSTFFGAKRRRPPRNKKGEIFHQWEKIRFECVCVFSLFCLGGKNIFLIFFSSPLYIF